MSVNSHFVLSFYVGELAKAKVYPNSQIIFQEILHASFLQVTLKEYGIPNEKEVRRPKR